MKKLIIASAMVLMAGPALAGSPGSQEPGYSGPSYDLPSEEHKDDEGVGPGVHVPDHNIHIGDMANDMHQAESAYDDEGSAGNTL